MILTSLNKQYTSQLEWRSRCLNIEIRGFPEVQNEKLLDRVNEVAEKLKVPVLSGTDVTSLHRLPSASNKVPGVIVRFEIQETKH